ncbi:hypothetical protein [Embleya sp. NPDC005971]
MSVVVAPWVISGEGALDPSRGALLMAMAAVAAKSSIGFVRVRRH